MPTSTTHYKLLKPLVNDAADQDVWGDYLNRNLDTTDTQMFTATSFVTRAVSGVDTATTTDSKKLLLCDATGAAFTVTLPLAATAGDGFTIAIKKTDASANAVTIGGNGAELIDGAATLSLASQNNSVMLACNGTSWYSVAKDQLIVPDASTSTKGIIQLATDAEAFAGTDALKAIVSSNFVKSFGTNGYARLPGGLILQWGETGSFVGAVSVTFPLAFPSAIMQGYAACQISASVGAPAVAAYNFTASSMTVSSGTSSLISGIRWLALGY